jgi:RND family efflux transporter MFP subunit
MFDAAGIVYVLSKAMHAMNPSRTRLLTRRIAAGALATCLVVAGVSCKKTAGPVASQPPQVVVAAVVQKDVPVYSEWVGTTEGFVNAEIYPKISGYLLKQNYQDGDHVKPGQLLFQIDDRQYKAALDQALGELAQKQADNKKNQQDIERYKPLYDQQVVSKQDYDHVNQSAHSSAAAVQAAQAAVETAKLDFDWCQVTSPIDGIAGIAKTQVGDLVGTTSLLTTVSQLDPIKVTFPISEREYLHFADRIKEHQETGHSKNEPALQMVLADGSVYKYPGHFYVANREVNVQTGTINIQGLFPNPDSILRPGLYAKVRSPTDTLQGALLVPSDAVLETQGQYQVAVVGADNKVTLRPVTLGKLAEGLRIISAGVTAGEHVITEGLQKVSDGMQVAPTLAPAESPSSAATPASQP